MLDMVIAVALLALLILLVLPALPRGTSAARLGGYASEVAALLKTDRTAAARAGGEVATRINLAERKVISGVRLPRGHAAGRCDARCGGERRLPDARQ